MKSIYLTLIIALSATIALGQKFSFDTAQHVYLEPQSESFVSSTININAVVSDSILYKWKRISNTFPNEWDCSLCDYPNCYTGIPDSGSMNVITNADSVLGQRGFFIINMNPGETTADALLEIYVYDANDFSRGDTISWHINYKFTGTPTSVGTITDNTEDEFVLYPNPASDELSLVNPADERRTVHLFNILGEQVDLLQLNARETLTIDLSSYRKGIYIAQLGTGKHSKMKRFVIQ